MCDENVCMATKNVQLKMSFGNSTYRSTQQGFNDLGGNCVLLYFITGSSVCLLCVCDNFSAVARWATFEMFGISHKVMSVNNLRWSSLRLTERVTQAKATPRKENRKLDQLLFGHHISLSSPHSLTASHKTTSLRRFKNNQRFVYQIKNWNKF